MQIATRFWVGALLLGGLIGSPSLAGGLDKTGKPDIQSAGALGFAPDGILLVGDSKGSAIFAIDTGDRGPGSSSDAINVPSVNEKVAALLGTEASKILINDVIVNPASGKVYLSVSRGRGPDAAPVIVRADAKGKLEEVALNNVAYAKAALPNAATGARAEAITDLGYVDGRVLVAGLSNEEFSSRLLSIPYPFAEKGTDGASIEIFHGAHGRLETKSPVRTFVTYSIKGESNILAAYTCTPLVKIPVADLKSGAHVKGKTIAELGNRNKPLDMIVYKKDGKDYLLLANSSRGVMKIPTEGADTQPGIVKRVSNETGKEGLTYDTISSLKNVLQLDSLGDSHALVLIQQEGGAQDLKTIDLP